MYFALLVQVFGIVYFQFIFSISNSTIFLTLTGFGGEVCNDVKIETATTTPAPSGGGIQKDEIDIRIPIKLSPFHYNLELRPHIYRLDIVVNWKITFCRSK